MLLVSLTAIILLVGKSEGFILRIGILHDHLYDEFYDTVYNSIHTFLDYFPEKNNIKVESVSFDLNVNPTVYDELLSYNLTAVIVAAKKLRCDKLVELKKRIPFYIVTGTLKSCDEKENENSLIYLYPPDSSVLSAILMAAEKYKWKNAIVLGENNKEFSFTFTIMQHARERGLETLAFDITIDKDALRQTLITGKREGIRSFILMSQLHHVEAILSIADELEIADKNFHWFIPNAFVVPGSLQYFVDKGMTITLLYSPIITPLIYKILQRKSENVTETVIMNEIVASLTLMALNKTISACEEAVSKECDDDEEVEWICRTSPDDASTMLNVEATSSTKYGHTHTPGSQVTSSTVEPTTKSNMMHGHMESDTSATASSTLASSKALSETTTTTSMMHGHMKSDISATASSTLASSKALSVTTTATNMMHGHMKSDTAATASSTSTSPKAHSETTTATNMMHGHMKRSVSLDYNEPDRQPKCNSCHKKHYVNSFCVKKSCSSGSKRRIPVAVSTLAKTPKDDGAAENLFRLKRSLTNETTMAPNPACFIYDWDDQTLFAAEKIVYSTLNDESENTTKNTKEESLQTIPLLETNIDSCVFTSMHKWNYVNDTCSLQLARNSEIPFSNTLFVVEYSPRQKSNKRGRISQDSKPIVVGVFNSEERSYIESTYEPLQAFNIFLPERDLIVGAIYNPPWLSWEIDEQTNETLYSGYLYEILDQLSLSMNFSYQIATEYDFSGELHNEKELEKHMMSAFDNNTVDLFLHAKSVHGNRFGKSDTVLLTTSFQQPYMYLLTKRMEKAESISIWQFMLPFREESWIVFWSSFILVSLLMAYFNKKNPNEYQAISHTFGPNSDPSDHLGILNSLWFTFAAICGQGADIVPRSSACVVLTGAWWGFLLLVVSAYTANMTAFMTQVNTGGIETLEELASQQQFSYGIMESSAMLNLFLPEARDAPYTTIFEYFHDSENGSIFKNQDDAFRRILEGNFYLMAEFESTVYALKKSCEFDIQGSGFYQYQFSFPFPRGSVYIQMFNDHIKKLRDRGVLTDLERKCYICCKAAAVAFVMIRRIEEALTVLGHNLPDECLFLLDWLEDRLRHRFTLEDRCETEVLEKNLENQLDIKAFTGMYVFLILGITAGMFICVMETGWIKYGGISGLLGKAGTYEVHTEKKDLKKANDLLEKEFESWEGGWKVWKFMEWKEGDKMEMKPGFISPASPRSPATKRCNTCGKRNMGEKFEPPQVTVHEITFEKSEKKDLTDTMDGHSSRDSGRESATSGQLTITESVPDMQEAPATPNEPSSLPNPSDETESFPTNVGLPRPEVEAHNAVTRIKPDTVTNKIVVEAVMHQHKVPLHSYTPVEDSRLASTFSAGSVSHSSLASGTLSFLSDSDVSVSTIHPRTPFPDSRASSRFAESTLTYDLESDLYSSASGYTTTSFETESAYSRAFSWSRSQQPSTSTFAEFTDDTRSDITVISRRRWKD